MIAIPSKETWHVCCNCDNCKASYVALIEFVTPLLLQRHAMSFDGKI